jgi:hypothetical protein
MPHPPGAPAGRVNITLCDCLIRYLPNDTRRSVRRSRSVGVQPMPRRTVIPSVARTCCRAGALDGAIVWPLVRSPLARISSVRCVRGGISRKSCFTMQVILACSSSTERHGLQSGSGGSMQVTGSVLSDSGEPLGGVA